MHLGKPANPKIKFIFRAGLIVLLLLFIIAFWREILGSIKSFVHIVSFLVNVTSTKPDTSFWDSFHFIVFNLAFGFGAVFLLWLFLISAQALLPVNNLKEVYRTAWHLLLFILGRHGQAVFVKDGEKHSTPEDEKHKGHGVIVIDFNSAVVLEERDVPPGLPRLWNQFSVNTLFSLGLVDPPSPTRVCGPGIVFTRPTERIHSVVDLRRQVRAQPNVSCYTREGIELSSGVSAVFTVGQDPEPEALQVTYQGEQRPENLRVCVFKPVSGRGGKYLQLAELSDELDEPDAREIHAFSSQLPYQQTLLEYSPLPLPPPLPVVNPQRVFAAAFAQARNESKETFPWTDLPTRLAADFFRGIFPQVNYDELYDLRSSNGSYPIPQFRRRLTLAMRNNGILAYRVVMHCTGMPFELNHVYNQAELVVSNIQQLTNSKLLRDRGIKVIASGFGDLSPVSELVYKQRLDSWRATWERELDITRAGRELQAMRMRSRALAEAQEGLWHSLNQIFSVKDHSEEALALLVLQAIETAVSDPRTQALLPMNTIMFMQQMHNALTQTVPQPAQPFPGLIRRS